MQHTRAAYLCSRAALNHKLGSQCARRIQAYPKASENRHCRPEIRGKRIVLGVEIRIPGKLAAKVNNYEIQKARKYFRARAGIGPVIGHAKHDHGMIRNYLSGTKGDAINTLLAATGLNMIKMFRGIKAKPLPGAKIYLEP